MKTPIAINTERKSAYDLLNIPLSEALHKVSRWLEDCEDYDPRREPRLPPVAPFTLAEAWVVVRLAAQDLATAWSYDLAAAPRTGSLQVAFEAEDIKAVSIVAAPLNDWSGVYAWRAAPAVPPRMLGGAS